MNGKYALIGLVSLLGAFLSGWGCPDQVQECAEVAHALRELDRDDELVARGAIRRLGGELADHACIMTAVGPLERTLYNEDKRRDLFTRSLVLTTLANVAARADTWTRAATVVEPLKKTVLSDQSDLLRAQASLALGGCGWSEVRTTLKAVSLTDESQIVRLAAEKALKRFPDTNVATAAPQDNPTSGETKPLLTDEGAGAILAVDKALTSEQESAATCISPDMDEWIKKHVIILDQDLADLPVCGQ